MADASQYQRRGEWSKKSPNAYSSAARNGWLEKCCSHMPKPKNSKKRRPLKWHKEACQNDAKRFSSRSEWQRQSNSAYNSAKNNKWLDECCAHMALQKRGSTVSKPISQYWDLDSCMKEAKKYTSISEWDKQSGASYKAALRNNWVDKCIAHMKYSSTIAVRRKKADRKSVV